MIRKVIKMNTNTDIMYGFKKITGKVIIILTGILLVTAIPALNYAFGTDSGGKPIREAHKVTVEDNKYCFFVTRNVVMTPAEIKGMTDEELTAEIFRRSGLYMKEANCRLPQHKVITVEEWTKAGRSFRLKDTDIKNIRNAEPADGNPVKLNMDVRIAIMPANQDKPADADTPADQGKPADADTPSDQDKPADTDPSADADTPGEGDTPSEGDKPSDDQEKPAEPVKEYSTFKLTSPGIVFIAIATENDASYTEESCEEAKADTDIKSNTNQEKASRKGKAPSGKVSPDDSGEDEMLPEFRTISMKDRSGGKLEETLQNGTPVTLEWIEPKKYSGSGEGKSFIDRIPGGTAGLTVALLIIAGLTAAAVVAIKNNQDEQ